MIQKPLVQETPLKKCKVEFVPVISIKNLFVGGFFRKMKAVTVCYPIKTHKINSMAKLLLRGYDYKSAKLCGTKNKTNQNYKLLYGKL